MRIEKSNLAFVGISALGFVAFLDFTVMNSALPIIQKDLKMNMVSLQWIMNIYFIVLACLMAVAGKLGDIFGRTKILAMGSYLFLFASLLGGFSINSHMIILSRFIQALGAATIFPMAPTLLSDVFSENKTKILGLYGSIGGAGLAAGPILGALFTSYISWRAIFFINVPICIVAIILCFYCVPKSLKQDNIEIDWKGLFLFVLSIGGLVYGIINSTSQGWTSPITVICILVAISSGIIFTIFEKKVRNPLLEPDLLKSPLFLIGALVSMCGGIISSISLFFIPLYLHSIREIPIMLIGLLLFSITVAYTISSLFVNRMSKKFGLVNTILIGMICALLSTVLQFFFLYSQNIIVYFIILPCIFTGICWSIGNILCVIAAHNSVTNDKIGSATGLVYTFFNIGGSIVLAIATVVFNKIENKQIFTKLVAENVHLNIQQKLDVSIALSNPETAVKTLAHIGSDPAKIIQIFKAAFINGYQGALLVLFVFIIGIVFISFIAKNKSMKKVDHYFNR